jgi:hypothetical protein
MSIEDLSNGTTVYTIVPFNRSLKKDCSLCVRVLCGVRAGMSSLERGND